MLAGKTEGLLADSFSFPQEPVKQFLSELLGIQGQRGPESLSIKLKQPKQWIILINPIFIF